MGNTGSGRSGGKVDESVEPDACPNCGAEKQGRYCALCGQNDRDYRRSMLPVVAHIVAETFEADSRVVRTIPALFLRPGFLSLEFSRNRRAHYLSPFRLYLFTSLLFFLGLSLMVGNAGGWSQAVKVGDGPIPELEENVGQGEGRRRPFVVIGVGPPDEPPAAGIDSPSSPDAPAEPSPSEIEAQVEALKRLLDPVRQRKGRRVDATPSELRAASAAGRLLGKHDREGRRSRRPSTAMSCTRSWTRSTRPGRSSVTDSSATCRSRCSSYCRCMRYC